MTDRSVVCALALVYDDMCLLRQAAPPAAPHIPQVSITDGQPAADALGGLSAEWLNWKPETFERMARLRLDHSAVRTDVAEVWVVPGVPGTVVRDAVDRGEAVEWRIGQFERSVQEDPWDVLTAYVLLRLAHESSGDDRRARRGRAFVTEELHEEDEPLGTFGCYWSDEGVFRPGPTGLTLKDAVAWCRDRAREVLVQRGRREYSAGDVDIVDLPRLPARSED